MAAGAPCRVCAAAATAFAALAAAAADGCTGAVQVPVTGALGDRDLPDVATGVPGTAELPRLLAVPAC